MAEFPGVDATFVVTHGEVAGANRKVSTLATICRRAKQGIIVVADSDIRMAPDALSSIASCYDDETVGAVTCLTVARPAGGGSPRPSGRCSSTKSSSPPTSWRRPWSR